MPKFASLKEDFLNSAQSLNAELWDRLGNSAQNRDGKKVGIIKSFIDRAEKIINETNLLFNDIEREFGQRPEKPGLPKPQNDVIVLFKNGKPAKINIFGDEIEIRKQNEIPISVANWLLDHGNTLPEVPNFIHRNKADFKMSSATPKPLKDGRFIEVGDDKNRLLDKARNLLKIAGLSGVVKVIEE